MTRDEQIAFVHDLSESILNGIVHVINQGKVPEIWDGIELRQLMAERTERSTYKMHTARRRAYENIMLINDL